MAWRPEARSTCEQTPGQEASPGQAIRVQQRREWPDCGSGQIGKSLSHRLACTPDCGTDETSGQFASLPVWTDFQIARIVSTARLPDCLLRQFEMSVTLLGPSYILPDWCVRQIGSGGIYQRCQASGQIGLAMPDCVLPDWTRLRISPDCQIALARLASDCLRLASIRVLVRTCTQNGVVLPLFLRLSSAARCKVRL